MPRCPSKASSVAANQSQFTWKSKSRLGVDQIDSLHDWFFSDEVSSAAAVGVRLDFDRAIDSLHVLDGIDTA